MLLALKNKINQRRVHDDRLRDQFQFIIETRVTRLYVIDFLIFIVIITIKKHLQLLIINSQHALHSSAGAVYFQEQLTRLKSPYTNQRL